MNAHVIELSIAADHPAYAGHFPGRPILPGVVLLDAALYELARCHDLATATGQLKSIKFLSPVSPGEALSLHYSEVASGSFRFEVRCHDRAVASGAAVFGKMPGAE